MSLDEYLEEVTPEQLILITGQYAQWHEETEAGSSVSEDEFWSTVGG